MTTKITIKAPRKKLRGGQHMPTRKEVDRSKKHPRQDKYKNSRRDENSPVDEHKSVLT